MRALILSDLHLEFGTSLTLPPGLEYDVVMLAGDISSPGHKAVEWAKRESTFAGKPVVYVAGNHEFYNAPEFDHEMAEMSRAAEGSSVHLLNRSSVVIGGVRFLGCMLWTDFQLPVRVGDKLDTDVGLALKVANQALNDFRLIKTVDYREDKRRLTAEDTLAMHRVDRDWLQRALEEPFDGPTVVVTHHAPSSGSVAARYAGGALTPAFASELPPAFFDVPVLWVHGHTHTTADYGLGSCRVVSNPRGYRMKDSSFENSRFDPRLAIELSLDGRGRAGKEEV
jgi:predicted phosphodiesterase